jgi:protein-tyrosine phosphatase
MRHHLAAGGQEPFIAVDSAGTHDYHVGSPPDARTIAVADARGYDLRPLRGRKVTRADFAAFDLILAMDQSHARILRGMAAQEHLHKVALFLEFGEHIRLRDVPDPYYGSMKHFEEVIDIIENVTPTIIRKIQDLLP